MKAPLVWINGYPGTGKLTVAIQLAVSHPDSVFVQNYVLIDPVHDRLGPNARRHPEYQMLRREERERAFNIWVRDPELADKMIIFTDFQSTSARGSSIAREYEAAAERAGRPFLPVNLICALHVNMERLTSSERTDPDEGNTRLTDAKKLETIRSNSELFRFETGLELCTTDLSANEAAKAILAALGEEVPSDSTPARKKKKKPLPRIVRSGLLLLRKIL